MGRCVHEADEKWGGESKGADEKIDVIVLVGKH